MERNSLEKSLELYRLTGHTSRADFGRVLSNLATICQRQADYQAAEQHYRDAVRILEAALHTLMSESS